MPILSNIGIEVVVGLAVTLIAGAAVWIWRYYRQTKDTISIIKFLEADDRNFLTTHFIASGVNLPEERVRKLCGKSKEIRRNQKEKESWTLVR